MHQRQGLEREHREGVGVAERARNPDPADDLGGAVSGGVERAPRRRGRTQVVRVDQPDLVCVRGFGNEDVVRRQIDVDQPAAVKLGQHFRHPGEEPEPSSESTAREVPLPDPFGAPWRTLQRSERRHAGEQFHDVPDVRIA